MKSIIYARVSTPDQEETGYSLPSQEKLLIDYSERKGFEIKKIYAVAEDVVEDMKKIEPWPVTYIDPAPAIARRTADVIEETPLSGETGIAYGTVILTSARGSASESLAAYSSMGFPAHLFVEMGV